MCSGQGKNLRCSCVKTAWEHSDDSLPQVRHWLLICASRDPVSQKKYQQKNENKTNYISDIVWQELPDVSQWLVVTEKPLWQWSVDRRWPQVTNMALWFPGQMYLNQKRLHLGWSLLILHYTECLQQIDMWMQQRVTSFLIKLPCFVM